MPFAGSGTQLVMAAMQTVFMVTDCDNGASVPQL